MIFNFHETWKIEPLSTEGDARRSSPQDAPYLVTPLFISVLRAPSSSIINRCRRTPVPAIANNKSSDPAIQREGNSASVSAVAACGLTSAPSSRSQLEVIRMTNILFHTMPSLKCRNTGTRRYRWTLVVNVMYRSRNIFSICSNTDRLSSGSD